MDSFAATAFLQIQSYSEHPEVYRMADLIVDSFLEGKARSHRQKYVIPARKLVASLWCHPSSFFRLSTSAEHYGTNRKPVRLDSNAEFAGCRVAGDDRIGVYRTQRFC